MKNELADVQTQAELPSVWLMLVLHPGDTLLEKLGKRGVMVKVVTDTMFGTPHKYSGNQK